MGRLVDNIETYLEAADTGDILEIGMDRGEGSTPWFINYAKRKGIRYVGCDIMRQKQMTQLLNNPPEHCEFHIMPGEDYLRSVLDSDQKFSTVYLDNFDWNYWGEKGNGLITNQKKDYEAHHPHCPQFDNVHSQAAHLNQCILLTACLTPNAVVVCDDTWYDADNLVYLGKCGAAIPYLVSIGFCVTHTQGVKQNSCVVLTRQCS